jgi:hypothetical protein
MSNSCPKCRELLFKKPVLRIKPGRRPRSLGKIVQVADFLQRKHAEFFVQRLHEYAQRQSERVVSFSYFTLFSSDIEELIVTCVFRTVGQYTNDFPYGLAVGSHDMPAMKSLFIDTLMERCKPVRAT